MNKLLPTNLKTNSTATRRGILGRYSNAVKVMMLLWLIAGAATQSKASGFSYNGPYRFHKNKTITPKTPIVFSSLPTLSYDRPNAFLNYPHFVATAVPNVGLFYTDTYDNVAYQIYDNNRVRIDTSRFFAPKALAVSLPYIYIVEGTNTVYKINTTDSSRTEITGLTAPTGLIADNKGNIYVNDAGTIKIIAPDNQVTTFNAVNTSSIAINQFGDLYAALINNPGTVRIFPAGGGAPVDSVVAGSLVKAITFDNMNDLYTLGSFGVVRHVRSTGQKLTIDTTSYSSPRVVVNDRTIIISTPEDYNTIAQTGGFSLTNPLPKGLNLHTATGVISGTPTEYVPETTYQISKGNASADLNIGVLPSLDSLITSTGFLTPSFDAGKNEYTLSLDSGITTLNIKPFNNDTSVTIEVNNVVVSPGEYSDTIDVSAAETQITVHVFANANTNISENYRITTRKWDGAALAYTDSIKATPGTHYYVEPSVATGIAEQAYKNTADTVIGSGLTNVTDDAMDSDGNLYVVTEKQLVKVNAADGAVTPLNVGTDVYGVSVDQQGNVYFTESTAGNVKKITAGGTTVELVAQGLSKPTKIAADKKGKVFIVTESMGQNELMVIKAGQNQPEYFYSAGVITDLITDGVSNPVIIANNQVGTFQYPDNFITTINRELTSPQSLAIDASNALYVVNGNVAGQQSLYRLTNMEDGNYTGIITNQPGFISSIQIDSKGYMHLVTKGHVEKFKPLGGFYSQTLPAGLVLNLYNGVIEGRATTGTPAADYLVTAYNPFSSASAAINIEVLPNQAVLEILHTDERLSPEFNRDSLNYTVKVSQSQKAVYIFASVPSNSGSTITVPGYQRFGSTMDQTFPITPGINTIPIKVTASDDVTERTYNITFNSISSSTDVSFTTNPNVKLIGITGPAQKSYRTSVGADVNSIRIKPLSVDKIATVKVNGVVVPRGTFSQSVMLTENPTVINIECVASDNVSRKTYSITVYKNGSNNADLSLALSNKAILTKTAGSAQVNYQTTVDPNTPSVMVIPNADDKNAVVTVNGVVVPYKKKSQPVTLTGNSTVINVNITAQDGTTTRSYTITVLKEGSNNANMTFAISGKPVVIEYSSRGGTSYEASIGFDVAAVTITPKLEDPNATVFINGEQVANKTASQPIWIPDQAHVVMQVIAQDGVTTKEYYLNIFKSGSNNANVKFTLKPNTKLEGTSSGTANKNYRTSVPAGTEVLVLKPLAEDANATVSVDGNYIPRGQSANVPLNETGVTMVNIESRAEDGETVITYSIAVSKNGSNNADLSLKLKPDAELVSTSGPASVNFKAIVPNTQNTVRVIPTAFGEGATITLNGNVVQSKKTSDIILLPGDTTLISLVCTAQNGATRSYSITVIRESLVGKRVASVASAPFTSAPAEVTVNKALSPNGDGVNDFLNVTGIENYPKNSLLVVNSKGVMVFSSQNYNNADKVFNGHNNYGAQLPAGTYYYVLEYNDGNKPVRKTGYIALKY